MASSDHDDLELSDLKVKFAQGPVPEWTPQDEEQCSNSSEDTICNWSENDMSPAEVRNETNNAPDPFVVYIKSEPMDDDSTYPGVQMEPVGSSLTGDAVRDSAVAATYDSDSTLASEGVSVMDQGQDQPPLDEQGSKVPHSGQPAAPDVAASTSPRRRMYHCDVCPKSFPYPYSLTRHKKIHERDSQSPSWRKKYEDPLKAFIRDNIGARPAECPECGKVFVRSSDLKRHEMIHTGQRLFKCEECGKSFTQASNLKTHQLTHTGEKTFVCDVCFKSFKLAGHLKTHQLIHSNQKSFECQQCGKAFTQQSNLKRHLVIHTGQKAFECGVCCKCFTHASGLKRHATIHNKTTTYECDGCGKTFSHPDSLKRHKRVNPECNLDAGSTQHNPDPGITHSVPEGFSAQSKPKDFNAHKNPEALNAHRNAEDVDAHSKAQTVKSQCKLEAIIAQCKPQVVKAECNSVAFNAAELERNSSETVNTQQ